MTTKKCSKCSKSKSMSEFYENKVRTKAMDNGRIYYASQCKSCVRVTQKQWANKNPGYHAKRYGSEYRRSSRLKRDYNLTSKEYDDMFLLQNGRCAICKKEFPLLAIDHSHETSKVRGLLCNLCNTALGAFQDNPWLLVEAISYLQKGGASYTNSFHVTQERSPNQSIRFLEVLVSMWKTHLDKNADYSPANIAGTGEMGLATRLWDKMCRLLNLLGFKQKVELLGIEPPRSPKNESIEDTYMDLAVYGIIGLLLREGKWGN